MDRKLKQKLDQYAVPDHSEKALEETIYRARELCDPQLPPVPISMGINVISTGIAAIAFS